ncbi:hypothetical protein B0H10DRAFT_1779872 [Mycena sp. CBHHK59/15]|nr:hypothetical protein B0H10DRAFT_1779872 [Mycena sp. CBHHK59/15]
MLILHPSSSCDVCLDAYTWTTPENTPHAIPCGHIFCKACLVSVEPMNCPLCRKAFNRERIKKLHVDRPDDDPELALLHRIVHTFGSTNVPEKAELIAELEAWLSGRAEDEVSPVWCPAASADASRCSTRCFAGPPTHSERTVRLRRRRTMRGEGDCRTRPAHGDDVDPCPGSKYWNALTEGLRTSGKTSGTRPRQSSRACRSMWKRLPRTFFFPTDAFVTNVHVQTGA